MGLSATYSVTASGQSLTYQWFDNGQAIAGATSSTYVTPATVFTDSGSQYTVTVSNAGGSVTSTPASLTVTARAPNPQDLRFQLVDAPETVNGWGSLGTAGIGNYDAYTGQVDENAIGTPLWLSGSSPCSGGPLADGGDCGWESSAFAVTPPGPAYGIMPDTYTDFPEDLTNSDLINDNGYSPASGGSVVTSIDIESATAVVEMTWIEDTQQSGFVVTADTVDPADLQAAVAQEGQSSHVITAISANNGQITFLSYLWQTDTTTVYETQVVTASAADTPAAAADLAQQGYIITALGPADTSGDLVMVGTRVAGDTMARPFAAPYYYEDGSGKSSPDFGTLQQQGYAVVGVVETQNGNQITYLMER